MRLPKYGRTLFFFLLCFTILSTHSIAGPPYDTDDPDPVDFRHFECYLSNHISNVSGNWIGNPPLLEVNYGGAPNLQLSVTVPMSVYIPGSGATNYGFGDINPGAKYRFIQEDSTCPQVSFYPSMTFPTGNASKELGAGKPTYLLPIWIQKTIGKVTTYGGGGYQTNSGADNHNYWFFGWQAQYQFAEKANIGAEIYYLTPQHIGGSGDLRFNLGTIIDFTEVSHIVFSIGRSIDGPVRLQSYIGYMFTM